MRADAPDRMSHPRFAQGAALATLGIAALAIVGWISGWRILTSLSATSIPMAPNTAMVLSILAVAVLAASGRRVLALGAWTSGAAAILAVLSSAALLGGSLAGVEMPGATFFVPSGETYRGTVIGRMSPLTAACLAVAGLAILARLVPAGQRWLADDMAAGLAVLVALAGAVVILGYLFSAPLLYGAPVIPMAFSTGLGLVTLGAAILALAAPGARIFDVLRGSSVRAQLLRAFIPTVIAILLFEDWLETTFLDYWGINRAIWSALAAMVGAAVGVGVVALVAQRIGRLLEASEAKYRRLHETMTDAFVSVDIAGRITESNASYRKMLGYSAEELLGVHYADLTPEKWHAMEAEIVANEILAGGYSDVYEKEYRKKDGTVLPVELRTFLLRDAAGNPCGMWAIVRDITDRKRAEQRRGELILQLIRKNAELERFAYTASHELKTPLVTIGGFLGVAQRSFAQRDRETFTSSTVRIQAAADHMNQLLDELLVLSRTGRDLIVPQPVSLVEVAGEVVGLLASPIARRGVRVTVAPDLPVVRGDRNRLSQVIEHLLANAVKSLGDQPDPQIEIGWRPENGQAVFFVRDNGIGIEPRYLEKLFRMFEKLDAGTEGTGIGLAIAQRIVESHGGRIWAESKGLGKGTTLCFTLPLESEVAVGVG